MASTTNSSTYLTPEQQAIFEEIVFLLPNLNSRRYNNSPGLEYLYASVAFYCLKEIFGIYDDSFSTNLLDAIEASGDFLAELQTFDLSSGEDYARRRKRDSARIEAARVAKGRE